MSVEELLCMHTYYVMRLIQTHVTVILAEMWFVPLLFFTSLPDLAQPQSLAEPISRMNVGDTDRVR